MPSTPTLYLNPSARHHQIARTRDDVVRFHRSLPDYAPTPVRDLPGIAQELGVGRFLVKDESSRLGLPAFKALGAIYALARALSERWGLDGVHTLEELAAVAAEKPRVTVMCATDGNHGRAVARATAAVGLPCRVFVPDVLSPEATQAISAEGADVRELAVPYDAVVDTMREEAEAFGPDALVIQDTAWPGYHKVPTWIVEGYSTMLHELDDQLEDADVGPVDLVLVQAGVGSFAQAVVAHYRAVERPPVVAVIEPVAAPAILHALLSGAPHQVSTGDTIMRGLNCGTPSELAWPVLQAGVDAALVVDDDEARAAVASLQEAGVDAGPCGAASLAGARRLLADARAALGIGPTSTVVMFNTESRAANPI